jgi:hypothetical protein
MPTTKQNDLDALSLDELRTRYHEATGEETKDRSKKRLIARITEAQESIAALEKGKELRAEAEAEAEPAPKAKASRKKAKAAEPATDADDAEPGEKKFSAMTVEELQAKHLEMIGRPTTSTLKRYLVWRCQQASKGRIPTGPRAGRGGNAGPVKVLPFRVPESAVRPLGEVQNRLGIRSRNEMFNRAMAAFLTNAGESDLAMQFGATFADDE